MFTTTQVKDGIDTGDLLLDLSDYMKKKDAEKLATKSALNELVEVVAGKLDATPQHKHQIDDIKQLQEELNSKYDKGEKYSHNVILNDTEKIAYLESPKVTRLEVAMNSIADGYSFYVDDSNGDLMIVSPASVLIATYSVAAHSWSFGGVKIDDITTHQEVLENHTEALNAVCNATLVNISDIAAVQDAVDNHSHETINNNLSVNGTLTVGSKIYTNSRIRLTDGADKKYVEIVNQGGGNLNAILFSPSNKEEKKITLLDVNGNTSLPGELNVNGTNVLAKITEMETILKNHYDALLVLCQKHGMVDSNTNDGSNVTPK